MPSSLKSATMAGPMLGICARLLQSSALRALATMIDLTRGSEAVADQANGEALDREAFGIRLDDDGLEIGVLGQQLDLPAALLETLDGDLFTDARDDDLAVACIAGL